MRTRLTATLARLGQLHVLIHPRTSVYNASTVRGSIAALDACRASSREHWQAKRAQSPPRLLSHLSSAAARTQSERNVLNTPSQDQSRRPPPPTTHNIEGATSLTPSLSSCSSSPASRMRPKPSHRAAIREIANSLLPDDATTATAYARSTSPPRSRSWTAASKSPIYRNKTEGR